MHKITQIIKNECQRKNIFAQVKIIDNKEHILTPFKCSCLKNGVAVITVHTDGCPIDSRMFCLSIGIWNICEAPESHSSSILYFLNCVHATEMNGRFYINDDEQLCFTTTIYVDEIIAFNAIRDFTKYAVDLIDKIYPLIMEIVYSMEADK